MRDEKCDDMRDDNRAPFQCRHDFALWEIVCI